MKQTISVSQIKQAVNEAYDLYKNNQDGKNADYIPYLANIDKNLFGISVCLLDGQIIEVGDTQYRFGIESVSKVHRHIGITPIWRRKAPFHDWSRCDRITVQFDNRYFVGKRSPLDPIG